MDSIYLVIILFTIIIGYLINEVIKSRSGVQQEEIQRDDLSEISKAGGLIEFIRQRHAQDGDIVEFYMGKGNRIVSINNPNLVKPTLKCGSRPKPLFEFLAPLLGEDNLQIFSAERASQFRKLVNNCLGAQVINQKYDIISNIANEVLIDNWKKLCDENKTVYLQDELLKFGLTAMIYTLFSIDLSEIDFEEFKNAYDYALGGLFDKQMNLWSDEKEEKMKKSIDYLRITFKKLIEKRKNLYDGESLNETSDLFDVLVHSNDPSTGKPFTDDMIISHLSGYLLAGYHTTAIATTWTLFALTQYPQIYKKVQTEIDETINGQPSLKDLEKLKYLEKVVKESLRFHIPGPFAARLIEDDITLSNNYTLKKGVTLFYPLFSIQRNHSCWSEPDQFNPDRFDNEIVPNSYCAFGYGPRICPGERLARMEIRLLIVLIMQKFNFKLDMDVNDVIPEERFVVMAKNDVRVKLSHRFN